MNAATALEMALGVPDPLLFFQSANPGRLSAAHASLENNCAACHSSVTGVDPVNCIACHADNQTLLEGQPTAFHAHVGTCKDCHLEHQGRGHRPSTVDHSVFARVALWQAGLYERSGYKRIKSFGIHRHSTQSVCFEKSLDDQPYST